MLCIAVSDRHCITTDEYNCYESIGKQTSLLKGEYYFGISTPELELVVKTKEHCYKFAARINIVNRRWLNLH